jgi:hypothetical protein
MPTAHLPVVDVENVTTFGKGTSDTVTTQRVFGASPIHSGELTNEVVREQFQALVIDGEVDDSGRKFGVVNRDYVDAPNLEEVETGGGGLPGTPYAPNIASPGAGVNPADIPEVGAEATERLRGGGTSFLGDGLQSPHESSARIAGQRLGSLMSGRSSGGA